MLAWLAASGQQRWATEDVGRDLVAAEREARAGCEQLEQMGRKKGWLSTRRPSLRCHWSHLDRDEEAEEWADRGRELGTADDVITPRSRGGGERSRARAAWPAKAGRGDDARCARARLNQTDMVDEQADARLYLADVLILAGRTARRADAIEQAVSSLRPKGRSGHGRASAGTACRPSLDAALSSSTAPPTADRPTRRYGLVTKSP